MRVLVAGCLGFIGCATTLRLLDDGHEVVGVDKIARAISPKGDRRALLNNRDRFTLKDVDLANPQAARGIVERFKPDVIALLCGQYSIRYTSDAAQRYVTNNVHAFVNIADAALTCGRPRLVYASSTFVADGVLPTSMYGATLEARERMANCYSAMGMETVGLRYGSTYGANVRPDTAFAQFARKLLAGAPIDVSRGGFGYAVGMLFIDDAVEATVRCLTRPMAERHNVATLVADDDLVPLGTVLGLMESGLGIKARRAGKMPNVPRLPVEQSKLEAIRRIADYVPSTKIEDGIAQYCRWIAERKAA